MNELSEGLRIGLAQQECERNEKYWTDVEKRNGVVLYFGNLFIFPFYGPKCAR